jgi:hypothetical protein
MAMLTEHVRQLIKQHPVAFVATSDDQNRPNVSPKGVLQILDDDKVVFADLFSEKTRANLQANPCMALAVVDAQAFEGYQMKGQAELLDQGPLYERVADLLARSSYGPQPMELWFEKVARALWLPGARPEPGAGRPVPWCCTSRDLEPCLGHEQRCGDAGPPNSTAAIAAVGTHSENAAPMSGVDHDPLDKLLRATAGSTRGAETVSGRQGSSPACHERHPE